jgi:hypothetical protein
MEVKQNQTEKSKLRWFGYVKRMNKYRTLRRFLEIKMSGRRPRSRQCMQYIDQVKTDVNKRGREWSMVEKVQEWADRCSRRHVCKH